jgi:hypothetical protein
MRGRPPPFGLGGGGTFACGRGVGGVPILTRGQTLWYNTLGKYVLHALNVLDPMYTLQYTNKNVNTETA